MILSPVTESPPGYPTHLDRHRQGIENAPQSPVSAAAQTTARDRAPGTSSRRARLRMSL